MCLGGEYTGRRVEVELAAGVGGMIGIIGGTGLSDPAVLEGFLENISVRHIATPYSADAVHIFVGRRHGKQIAFLPRHGKGHKVPPHLINYRANIWALHHIRVTAVIGVNAVGGIHSSLGPGKLAIPEQIIDYSWGREHTFLAQSGAVTHIDFTTPYDENLRQLLIASAADVPVWPHGVYGCTQGPRLETAAEVARLGRDGCDMIGMTGMPEAALARELSLAYACIAISVNWAAGLSDEVITMESIGQVLDSGIGSVKQLLDRTIATYNATP